GIRDFHVTGVQTCALPICNNLTPFRSRSRIFHLSTTPLASIHGSSFEKAFSFPFIPGSGWSDGHFGLPLPETVRLCRGGNRIRQAHGDQGKRRLRVQGRALCGEGFWWSTLPQAGAA